MSDWYHFGIMADKEIPRSLRFPERLWVAISIDAKRCRRSSQKQLEALLMTYYDLDDVEINKARLNKLKSLADRHKPAEPDAEIIELDNETEYMSHTANNLRKET